MTSLRIGRAPRGPGLVGAVAFPGGSLEDPRATRAQYLTGLLALALHAGLVGALLLASWLAPEVVETLIPIERVDAPSEQAPAPRVLAERRAVEFNPRAAAVTPQIVDPAIVPQTIPIDAPRVAQLEPTAAPVQIEQTQILARRVTEVATASSVPVPIDVPTAPAARTIEPVQIHQNVGPRQIVSPGQSVGDAVSDIQGTAVKEGITSTRDVLGSPRGTAIATVNSRVGEGFLIGEGTGGGLGSGGSGEGDCQQRPEVQAYWAQIRSRMYARWVVPLDTPTGQTVKLRFKLDVGGVASSIEVVESSDPSLGDSALAALRAASPFEAMSERVRCLAGRKILATFELLGAGG